MKRKLFKNALLAGALAASGLAFIPSQANAFTIRNKTLIGDVRPDNSLDMSATVNIHQGQSSTLGLPENQAEWVISLVTDNPGDSLYNDFGAGFKQLGFNLAAGLADTVNIDIASFNPNWSVARNAHVNGGGFGKNQGDAFDFVLSANGGNNRDSEIRFKMTAGTDPVLDALTLTDFTGAAFSSNSGGIISGQVAGHVIGLAGGGSGIVAGEVPTPALLPGLIGMGVAALRKRKSAGELPEEEA